METEIYILVVEDESEVLDSIIRDIESFEDVFPIETASTAEEAREVIAEISQKEARLGLLLCDHLLPGEDGVDLLISLNKQEAYKNAKKVLITGQAGLEDTVQAVNNANLDHYIAKPWDKEQLQEVVRNQLTTYVIEQNIDPLPFMSMLDAERLAASMRDSGRFSDT
mgnify:CR=1 FL=1